MRNDTRVVDRRIYNETDPSKYKTTEEWMEKLAEHQYYAFEIIHLLRERDDLKKELERKHA